MDEMRPDGLDAEDRARGINDDEFQSLLDDIINNPEKALKTLDESKTDISPEQILEIQKRFNPYTYVPKAGDNSKTRVAACSITNMREEWIRKFVMTSLIGFVFQLAREWEVPENLRRWVPATKKHHGRLKDSPADGPQPLTTDEYLKRAELFHKLARDMKDAEAAVATAMESLVVAESKAGKEDRGPVKHIAIAEKNLRQARARYAGVRYGVTHLMYTMGEEADDRIDAEIAAAEQFPESKDIVANDPIKRAKPGQIEMPQKAAKSIIDNFLRKWFEYDPSAHVRKAFDEFKIKCEAVDAPEGKRTVDCDDVERVPLPVLRSPATVPLEADREPCEIATSSDINRRTIAALIRDSTLADAARHIVQDDETRQRFKRYLYPIDKSSPARPAIDVIPPQDTFHRWEFYTAVNFEELRSATEAIYHDKPELDLAIILYEYFEGSKSDVSDQFKNFCDMHQDEVITDIKAVNFGGWTLLGDFKKNRKRMEFLNKNTVLLQRIFEKKAEDKALGAELMRNRVRDEKAKNIREVGPDSDGLKEHRRIHGAVESMGAERVIKPEEMKRLERARGDRKAALELEHFEQCEKDIKVYEDLKNTRTLLPEEELRLRDLHIELESAREMLAVPDGAIQVNTFTHDPATGDFKKSFFYTKSTTDDIERIKEEREGGGGSSRTSSRKKAAVASSSNSAPSNNALPNSAPSNNASSDDTLARMAPFAKEYLAQVLEKSRQEDEQYARRRQVGADSEAGYTVDVKQIKAEYAKK